MLNTTQSSRQSDANLASSATASSRGEESARGAGDLGSVSGLGRSPGEGNGHPLQYSCLRNPMDRGAYSARGCKRVGRD